jgi:hypothetical protein
MTTAVPTGDVLLARLPAVKRNIILWFVDAHRHDKNATDLVKMQFVSQAMSIVADTPLAPSEKKILVMYMYTNLATNNASGFTSQFDIGGAIEFVWDTYTGKYTITAKKRGCLSDIMCCTSASVTIDTSQKKVDVKTTNEEQKQSN